MNALALGQLQPVGLEQHNRSVGEVLEDVSIHSAGEEDLDVESSARKPELRIDACNLPIPDPRPIDALIQPVAIHADSFVPVADSLDVEIHAHPAGIRLLEDVGEKLAAQGQLPTV